MANIIPGRVKLAAAILLHGNLPRVSRNPIPAITPEEVAEACDSFPMKKFFISGYPRSGTTLLARLIRLHPQVHCNWQAHFFTKPPFLKSLVDTPAAEQWLAHASNRWNRGRDLSPVVLRAMSDFILERDARRLGKTIVGDKSPASSVHVQAIRDMYDIYPDAYVIQIVRDGRDALISHRFQTFVDGESQLSREESRIRTDFINDPAPFLAGQRSLFGREKMAFHARHWVQTVMEMHNEAKVRYGERYLSLRYEDLLARPWEEMQRVWKFLGAKGFNRELEQAIAAEMQSNPDADWQREKNGDIARSLQKGRQGTWRNVFTPPDRQIFKEVAGQTLVKWGYEKDLNW